MMFGLLNIHKPSGMTSRDVVNRVQRLLRGVRLAHAGTLDPLATGVLVVAVGPATRLVEYIQRMPNPRSCWPRSRTRTRAWRSTASVRR